MFEIKFVSKSSFCDVDQIITFMLKIWGKNKAAICVAAVEVKGIFEESKIDSKNRHKMYQIRPPFFYNI